MRRFFNIAAFSLLGFLGFHLATAEALAGHEYEEPIYWCGLCFVILGAVGATITIAAGDSGDGL